MDFFIDWLTIERFLEWKEGMKQLKESKGPITDGRLIEEYQDYRNCFKELVFDIEEKFDECDIGYSIGYYNPYRN
jgi:hypothetical protein